MSHLLGSTSSRPQTESHSSGYHQMTKCLVKPFKPQIDLKSISYDNTNLKKYICDQCLDEFIHESSLTTHLERRSVRITYLCEKCKSNYEFFNRCALLSHIRSHSDNEKTIDHKLAKVLVQPIDLGHLSTTNDSNNTTKRVNNSID